MKTSASFLESWEKIILVCSLIWLPIIHNLSAQGLRFNLDETGETYLQGCVRGQFWLRYMEMNPGTTLDGQQIDQAFDISMRRLRIGLNGQITPKLFVYTLFGQNNINVASQKDFKLDMLDFNAEYSLSENIAVGIGKTGWVGLSRWNVRSSKSMMALDAPLFSLLTINKNDDLGRTLGVWAKGQISNWDYVLALKQPATYGNTPVGLTVDYSPGKERLSTSGYIKYEFWDDESNKTAYSGGVGSYLGKKRLLNIGGGFLFQPDMMANLVDGEIQHYDFKNIVIEVFMEKPTNFERTSIVTSYLGWFRTDFGPNYIRNVGANDYTSGGISFNGSGNDFPMIGTGKTLFAQLGYLWSYSTKGETKQSLKVQPNLSIQLSEFEALDDPMLTWNLGVNLYQNGHDSKLSLDYQNRPIYESIADLIVETDRKGMLVLQYQIEIN